MEILEAIKKNPRKYFELNQKSYKGDNKIVCDLKVTENGKLILEVCGLLNHLKNKCEEIGQYENALKWIRDACIFYLDNKELEKLL
jgi:hypothetical protein